MKAHAGGQHKLLMEAIDHLRWPAERQLRYLHDMRVGVDELALEFDDAFRMMGQFRRQGLIGPRSAQIIEELNQLLSRLSGPANAEVWTEQGLQESDEWAQVRRLAGQALDLATRKA